MKTMCHECGRMKDDVTMLGGKYSDQFPLCYECLRTLVDKAYADNTDDPFAGMSYRPFDMSFISSCLSTPR